MNLSVTITSNRFLEKIHFYSPASEASREVANLTEIKNPHTPVYGIKKFVNLYACGHLDYHVVNLSLTRNLFFMCISNLLILNS